MSDSDSSEDELNAQLLEAVDTSFLSNTLYNPKSQASQAGAEDSKAASIPNPEPKPVSNRYLLEERSIFQSELNVHPSVQKHTAEKISKLLDSVIEFDDSFATYQVPQKMEKLARTGVRLLAGFEEVIDPIEHEEPRQGIGRAKPTIKMRRIKDDDEPAPNRADNIASSVCEPSAFVEEVRHWTGPRKRSALFCYKTKKDGTNEQKPIWNEFTKERNKNKWQESKIRNFGKLASTKKQ